MLQNDPWALIHALQSVVLSTTNQDGTPHGSYAPFIEKEKHFYIFGSMMSTHTQNLLHNRDVSLLFIEDESLSANIFARKRVTFDAEVTPVERGSILFNGTLTLFEEKFGEMASIYRSMSDFQLFALTPVRGRAVFGFGQAYDYRDGAFETVRVGRAGGKRA